MGKKKKEPAQKPGSKKNQEFSLVAKGNLQFKNFAGKRNNSKIVIVRPK